jgi:hypothetical protein
VALLATTFEPWMLMLSALMFRLPVTLRLDIQATNNLDLKAKTIANIASEQTITKGTNITQSVGSASNLQGGNVNINQTLSARLHLRGFRILDR